MAIEAKYHENMRDRLPAQLRPRYRALARASGAFRDPDAPELWSRGVWQVWLDHLLAWSLRLHPHSDYDTGLSVLLYPAENEEVAEVSRRYVGHLAGRGEQGGVPFEVLTLEACVRALEAVVDAGWVGDARRRYLDFSMVDRLVPAG